MNITRAELNNLIRSHNRWLRNELGGIKADLSGADLTYANLSGVNLSGANLSGANLFGANLNEADLGWANLYNTNLTRADLTRANLFGAILTKTNMDKANLTETYLMRYGSENSRIQSLWVKPYKIFVIDKEIVWGGCTRKTVQEWLDYSGNERSEKDRNYLETVTKPFIRLCIA